MQRKRLLVLPCLAVLLALATVSLVWRVPATAHAAVAVSGLHVSGNQLLNSSGQVVRLVGVNRSSAEYSCNSGGTTNVFDDPNNLSDIPAMLSWSINVVRIPLNEDCWLGINGEPSASYTAAYYQQQITSYVNQLTADNLIVILDLHWNNSGSNQANSQEPMPDLDHAPATATSGGGVAGPHEDPPQPGIEPRRVAQRLQVDPRAQQRVLDHVRRQLVVAHDHPRYGEQPPGAMGRQRREGLHVAVLCAGDEIRIVHARPACPRLAGRARQV